MFLHAVGTVKLRIRAVISPSVKTNGTRNYATRKNRISQLSKVLTQALQNEVSVTVITRPPENFKESEQETVKENTTLLQNCGVNVMYKSDFHQKFTIVDNQIVWYGSFNFLSFGTNEESIMRFVSFDVAGELTDTVI